MVMIPFIVISFMASVSVAGTIGVRHEHTCGTENLSPENRILQARQQNDEPDNGQEIELEAVFHFCCASQADCPTDEVAKNEIKVMNKHYAPAKIKFNLKNTTQINDAACSQTDVTDANTMDNFKAQSHTGGTDTLNIVYVPTNEGPGAKGVCIIPPAGGSISQSVGDKDGCVVATSTLPGQAKDGGDDSNDVTSVHEAGHWLSLEHTSQTGGGGYGSRRRRSSETRNIMEPVQITGQGISYQFDQAQITQLRQTALRRKAQGSGGGGGGGAKPEGPDGPDGNNEPTVPNNPGGNEGPGGNNRPYFPSNPRGDSGPDGAPNNLGGNGGAADNIEPAVPNNLGGHDGSGCDGSGGANGPNAAGVPTQPGPGAFRVRGGDSAEGSRGRVNSTQTITGSGGFSGRRSLDPSLATVAGRAKGLVHIVRRCKATTQGRRL